MLIEDLKATLVARYSWLDSEILTHANSYYLTASTIYETLDDQVHSLYPLLTLLGLSAELFLKAFSLTVGELFSVPATSKGSLLKKTVSTSNMNSHNLGKLLRHYSTRDNDLYCYLILRYKDDTGRALQEDLSDYSMVFVDARYIFECDGPTKRKYSSDVSVIFYLVQSLYNSVTALYQN